MAAPTPSPAALYTRTAHTAAAQVIRRYSTSFSWACRTLPRQARQDVATIYAMVRVADEVVDGVAVAAGLDEAGVRAALDDYERACEAAMASGFATDPVLHAFADVARRHGITPELTRPFFASMRADLGIREHGAESLDAYIHGSAEVVGLMCLQVFLLPPRHAGPDPGPAAGAARAGLPAGGAFQKVNFLRDLAADHHELAAPTCPVPHRACSPRPARPSSWPRSAPTSTPPCPASVSWTPGRARRGPGARTVRGPGGTGSRRPRRPSWPTAVSGAGPSEGPDRRPRPGTGPPGRPPMSAGTPLSARAPWWCAAVSPDWPRRACWPATGTG
ncbi:squalene/phytoene synthase family protein [Rhodococcus hoagii]|nr:squalene/phytoene synthase family protein [Prescottella equi]